MCKKKALFNDQGHNKTDKSGLYMAFHRNRGMKLIGKDVIDGVNVVLDYSGPGEHRIVFMKNI